MSISHWVVHITLAVCLAFASIGWYQASHKAADQAAVIATLLKASAADKAVLGTRESVRASKAPIEKARAAKAQASLASAPDWADTPIPEGVLNALAQ